MFQKQISQFYTLYLSTLYYYWRIILVLPHVVLNITIWHIYFNLFMIKNTFLIKNNDVIICMSYLYRNAVKLNANQCGKHLKMSKKYIISMTAVLRATYFLFNRNKKELLRVKYAILSATRTNLLLETENSKWNINQA